MPLTKRGLDLAAEPRSVGLARAWVRDVLADIDRDDLIPNAELGVSELVTNAIMHGTPPIMIRIRGTVGHPRIEVVDHSPAPMTPPMEAADDDLPMIGGRGLVMVAMSAKRVGTDTDPERITKRVWFEPSESMEQGADVGPLFAQAVEDELTEPTEPLDGAVLVELQNMPAQLFQRLRRYHADLRRETTLLALADPDGSPLFVEMKQLFDAIEKERRQCVGMAVLNRAIAAGVSSVDVVLRAPPSAPASMRRATELLLHLYDDFGDARLLNVVPPSPLRELQSWYLGEFVRQGDGERPQPWTGPLSMPGAGTETA